MRLVFFGTPAWAAESLRALAAAQHTIALVVTAPDAAIGRSRTPQPPAVKQQALALELSVLQPSTLRDPGARATILAAGADAFVVVAYGRILPGRLLDAPRYGAINLHFSLLPRHRGASPVQHTILAGDAEAGVTTIRMDRGLDTGPVWLRRAVAVPSRSTSSQLGAALSGSGAALLCETLDRLVAGTIEATAQDERAATLAPLLRREHGAVDWNQPAERIDRLVRAFDPWPPVICAGPKGPLRLVEVEPVERPALSTGAPGTVLGRDGEAVLVAAGAGTTLRIMRVLPSGGREMPAAAALAGGVLVLGAALGAAPIDSGPPDPGRRG